jgi:hypothetical protein
MAVYDSRWEAAESFELDRNDRVHAWVKNDHLGFEILYVFRGVVKKYRPDFLIRLVCGEMLVLEVKGSGHAREQDQAEVSGGMGSSREHSPRVRQMEIGRFVLPGGRGRHPCKALSHGCKCWCVMMRARQRTLVRHKEW